MKTLYLCYYGVREPLVQTQVLPYLRQLVAAGIEVSLLTFEPQFGRRWTEEALANQAARLAGEGIRWRCRAYHKSPSAPATAYDILAGAWVAARLARRFKIDVLHARSHVPVAMALLARTLTGCRLVFDVRGLWAEEYVDIGNWAEGSPPFRAIKKLERVGLRKADQVVVLTHRMRDWLVGERLADAGKISVIPCCTDVSRFAEESPADADAAPRFEIVYAGTATGLHLLEEVGQFFLKLRAHRADAFLRVLTHSPSAEVATIFGRVGLSPDDYWIGAVEPAEVPKYFRRARAGVSFRKATFAQIAASPAKIPEYLAAGLPVIFNAGVGDMDDLLEKESVGLVLKELDDAAYEQAARRLVSLVETPEIRERCREVARRYFDLEQVGGAGYLKVYRRISDTL
ncbi:MAG: glycosyltransferase family 4 protein [Pyrinomonadaceae bacterium]